MQGDETALCVCVCACILGKDTHDMGLTPHMKHFNRSQ